ncbi:MAG: PHP domain-containing protein, partial [Eudoraea sp.]|nr:PHP domain-containing protein [Eudoraea sp.]
MYLIFDTETTGLPKRWDAPLSDLDNWPRCVQIAWQLHDEMGVLLDQQDYLIKPEGFNIPYDAEVIHGISTELASQKGEALEVVLEHFSEALAKARFIVGQNVGFDLNIMGAEFLRLEQANLLEQLPILDTCTEDTALLCKIPGGRGGKFKLPTLSELHAFLFDEPFVEAHNATADVEATARCFFELIRQGKFTATQLKAGPEYLQDFKSANPEPISLIGLKHINFKEASKKIREQLAEAESDLSHAALEENMASLADVPFVHLHNHSQFSVLQSTIRIKDLVQQTAEFGMTAVALTDHANMMGAFHFVKEVKAHNKTVEDRNKEALEKGEEARWKPITPIIGCEFHVCEDHVNKNVKDYGYQVVFLAKNKNGYHNLAKMSSLAYTDGFYYVPRIDKKIVAQYKDDLIVLTGNLYGEIPAKILNQGEKQAEEALIWWKESFGDDLYVEIMRH